MENYLLPYALMITIFFFFAIIALVFAFKTGNDTVKENKDLRQANESLRNELYNRIIKDKKK